jgi:hypothetical protein
VEKRLVGLYKRLLVYLPQNFKDQFAEEMETVFIGRIREVGSRGRRAMIRLFIGELLAQPGLWFLAYQRERRVLKMNGSQVSTMSNEKASWKAAIAAILPLVCFPLLILMTGTLRSLLFAAHLHFLYYALWTDVTTFGIYIPFYLLLLFGFLFAWLRDFPRWSYTYLGWLMIILISGLGISELNDPYLKYLKLIWGPFLVALLFAILLNPTIKPLKALWRSWLWDWTLASFMLFSILEFMVLASFYEMPGPSVSRVFWQALAIAVLVGGALWYMRASGRNRRILILLSSATLSIAISVGVTAYYWHNFPKPNIQFPINGYAMITQGMIFMLVVFAFLLAPALLSATLNRLFPNQLTG